MKINPIVAATAIHRYERVVGQKVATAVNNPMQDRIEISDRAQLYTSLIKAAKDSDTPVSAKIHGIINRLASGSYDVDLDNLAEKMMATPEDR